MSNITPNKTKISRDLVHICAANQQLGKRKPYVVDSWVPGFAPLSLPLAWVRKLNRPGLGHFLHKNCILNEIN